jgi:tripartite-type tricarboxylate transporter receptor subunit TctC
MNSKAITAAVGAVLLCVGGVSWAAFPERPIRILVPFPPGGGNDALIRSITPKLSESLGQTIVVDNRGGAGGNIAAEATAKATPDGYTLLMGFSTVLTTNKSLYKNVGFDPIKDFAPITQLATAQYLLVVHPSVAARDVKQLVALAKAKPGSLSYASSGVGTPLHLAAELFKRQAGVDIVHIAYKGGGPAAIAMLSGEVQLAFSSMAAAMGHVQTGKLRALGVTSLKRSSLAPDVPTLDESGFKGFNVTAWGSLVAPAGTPRPVINLLNEKTNAVLRLPEIRTLVGNVGYDATGTTPEQLWQLIRSESETWAQVIKDANIRAD